MKLLFIKAWPIASLFALVVLLQSCERKTKMSSKEEKLEVANNISLFAQVDEPVGNIAYADNGDLIYSHHPFFGPKNRVMRYDLKTKQSTPFPNQDWNTVKPGEDYLNTVLGLRSDANGIVWMLDMGFRNDNGAKRITPKFVGWNTKTDRLEEVIKIPEPASIPSSQLNDFVIDDKHQVFIIADENIGPGGDGSKAALVVVYRSGKKARRLLQGHYSTIPEQVPIVIKEGKLQLNDGNGQPLLVGADGITADKDNEWLYYAPLSGTKVYRVKIADLLDETLTDSQLGNRVETYATGKENNGSIAIDKAGNLYLTYVETKSIGIVRQGKNVAEVYISHPDLRWPDGTSTGKDGYMYVPATQLYLGAPFQQGTNKAKGPFGIYRFKPLAEGLFGR